MCSGMWLPVCGAILHNTFIQSDGQTLGWLDVVDGILNTGGFRPFEVVSDQF